MKTKQYSLMLTLALVAGLIGGFVSSCAIQPVIAEKTVKPPKVIEGQEFRLVDMNGKVWGEIGIHQAGGSSIFLQGKNSQVFLGSVGANASLGFAYIPNTAKTVNYGASITVGKEFGPMICLSDETGVRAVLGRTKLRDEKTEALIIRSLASLILFDEKGNVLWKAPE